VRSSSIRQSSREARARTSPFARSASRRRLLCRIETAPARNPHLDSRVMASPRHRTQLSGGRSRPGPRFGRDASSPRRAPGGVLHGGRASLLNRGLRVLESAEARLRGCDQAPRADVRRIARPDEPTRFGRDAVSHPWTRRLGTARRGGCPGRAHAWSLPNRVRARAPKQPASERHAHEASAQSDTLESAEMWTPRHPAEKAAPRRQQEGQRLLGRQPLLGPATAGTPAPPRRNASHCWGRQPQERQQPQGTPATAGGGNGRSGGQPGSPGTATAPDVDRRREGERTGHHAAERGSATKRTDAMAARGSRPEEGAWVC